MADNNEGWVVVGCHPGDPDEPDLGSPWVKVSHPARWSGHVFTVRFGDGLVVKGFDVDCGSGEHLSAEGLRKVPLGEIATKGRAHLAWMYSEVDKGRSDGARRNRPFPKELTTEFDMRRRGRRGRSDADLAIVAAAYVRCCDEAPATPLKLLSEKRGLDAAQLRGLLYQARKRDLLTDPPHKGIPGGILTDKAWGLLPTASDRATPEQRQSARDRDRRLDPIHAAYQTGQITHDEWLEANRKEGLVP
jgi:hypothetical protein